MADMNTIGGLHYEMMRRCYNPKSIAYKDYGAKGIGVCEEWHNREVFRKWAKENGFRKGLRLERIDSSKDYCPDNCRLGISYKGKNGYSKMVRERAKVNKRKKEEIGVTNLSHHPIYKSFVAMHERCENPNKNCYNNYGGRGITVCDEWSGKNGAYNFIKWSLENGWEKGLSIDRIDNNMEYCPDNCRWATSKEQVLNRRCTRFYDYHGEMLCASDIARRMNLSKDKVTYRLKQGWSVGDIEKIFDVPQCI